MYQDRSGRKKNSAKNPLLFKSLQGLQFWLPQWVRLGRFTVLPNFISTQRR